MKSSLWLICIFSYNIAIAQPVAEKDLVYVHGGGFMEGSSKDPSYPFCDRHAKYGFVVANVEYRTGFGQSVRNFVSDCSKFLIYNGINCIISL